MLSDVSIVRQQGLGKTAVRQDGIAGLVADGVALLDKVALETPFVVTSLSEAESLGITEQYDKTNKVLLWHHISDFYAEAPRGTSLYVVLVAKQTEMVDSLDVSDGAARKLLSYAKGAVKLLAVTSMSDDWDSSGDKVSAAQALYDWAAARNKAVQILLEGRAFSHDAYIKLRELTANRVSVVIGHDAAVAAEDTAYANYAAVARFMGRLAAIPVSRDAGRVRTGAVNIATAGLSDGKKATDPDYYDDDQLSAIDSAGYIFLRLGRLVLERRLYGSAVYGRLRHDPHGPYIRQGGRSGASESLGMAARRRGDRRLDGRDRTRGRAFHPGRHRDGRAYADERGDLRRGMYDRPCAIAVECRHSAGNGSGDRRARRDRTHENQCLLYQFSER